jgi:microcystin-dependent protein
MEIPHWENTDKWGPLRDIINELVDAVNLSMPPIGSVVAIPSETAPNARWILCEGQELSRTTYSELFAIYGTTFGEGDGSTTFNLPNLINRTIFGKGGDVGDIGDVGGEANVLLTAKQSGLRLHRHNTNYFKSGIVPVNAPLFTDSISGDTQTVISSNIDGPTFIDDVSGRYGEQDALEDHNNLPPYVVMNWFVRVL